MPTIAFATYRKSPGLTADDALVVPFLNRRNIDVIPVVWDDPHIGWEQFEAVVIRSCWDYHLNEKKFRHWLTNLKNAGVTVWNPTETILWNIHKGYLKNLARRGVVIPQTIWIEPGGDVDLKALMTRNGMQKAVIKPVVSATAHRTWIIGTENARQFQRPINDILLSGGAMVQEYLPEITRDGEWSLMFFNRKFSHAVKKRAKEGDFRVQSQFGGSACLDTPSESLIHQAERVLESIEHPLLYARVDGIERDSQWILIELEIIEPELFLRLDTAAPEQFAIALATLLQRSSRIR